MPKATRIAPATAPVNCWLRKKCMSSIGYGIRSSHTTNAARTTRPTSAEKPTCADVQPCCGPEMIA